MSKKKPVSAKRKELVQKEQSKCINNILAISHVSVQLEHAMKYPSRLLMPHEKAAYKLYCEELLAQLRGATKLLREFNQFLGDIDLQYTKPNGPVLKLVEPVGKAVTKQEMTQVVYRDKNGRFAKKR